MLKLYVHKKCSTCQKALKFVNENSIVCEIIDIQATPPSKDELALMLRFQKNDLKKLMNTSGLLYRSLNLKDKLDQMSEGEILNLLQHEGMLVKRPFIIDETLGLVGFKEAEWKQKFSV